MPRIKRLVKEGSWIIFGQGVSVVASLVSVRVLTEYLNPIQYGQLALSLTVAGLINQVVMGGINSGIGRFYSIASEKRDLNGYLFASRRLMFYSTIVTGIISLLILLGLAFLGYSKWITLALAAIVFSVFSSYNNTLNSIQNAARQRAVVAFNMALDAWIKIGLALCAMFFFGRTSVAIVIGYACSSLLVIFAQLFFFYRTIAIHNQRSKKNYEWIGKILFYSLPFAAWGIFGWAQQSSIRWSLAAFTTTENVGLFSLLSQIGYAPIQIVTATGISFLTPILFARVGDGRSEKRNENLRNLTKKLVILGLASTIFLVTLSSIFHLYIFQLFVNPIYFSVSHFLPWVVLAGAIFSIAQLLASNLMALLMTRKLMVASILSSVIGIAAAVLGTYYFSLEGAIISMVVHAASYFILLLILVGFEGKVTQ